MNTLRTLVIFAVLGAVGYGVYATLNRRPPVDPPVPISEEWTANPDVDLANEESAPPQPMHGVPTNAPGAGGVPPVYPPHAALPNGDAPLSPAPSASALSEPPPYASAAPPAQPSDPSLAPPAQLFPGNDPSPAPVPVPSTPANTPAPNAVATDHLEPAGAGPVASSSITPPAVEVPGSAAPPGSYPPAAQPLDNSLAAAAPPAGAMPGATANTPTSPPMQGGDFAAAWQSIQQSLSRDRLVDAHRELSRWYGDPRLGQAEPQVQQLLDQLAGTIVYSRESFLEQPYEVQPGDTLERIAEHYGVPWQLLGKINGIPNPAAVRIGEKLKVLHGPFAAEINVTKFSLTLWLNDLYAGSFPIGVGVDQTTPDGIFQVENKLENPTYYGPDQTIDANDPSNPLGERWIAIGNHLGIHGTTDPQSIGRAASRGCIRLTERDVDDVYDILTVGSRITIRR